MRDRFCFSRVIALLALFLLACQPAAPAQKVPPPAPAKEPAAPAPAAQPAAQPPAAKPAGPTRITVGVTETMDSPNPYGDSVAFLYSVWCEVYGCLVKYDAAKADYGPWLAESWKVENPTTWVFNLNKNVKFSDGSPMTSADVVHSFNYIQNNPLSKQKANIPTGAKIEAVDNYTVKVMTREPTSSLLDYFADRLMITSKAHFDKVGESAWEQKAVSAGPYTLKEFVPGQRIVLAKSANYWGGQVQGPDEVVYRLMREAEVRVTALLNNEIQIAQTVPPHLAERVSGNPNTKIVGVDSSEIMFVAMSPQYKPWENKLLRQAVAHAIDRDAIIKSVLLGQARRLDGPIGPGAYGYNAELQPKYTYNPERARQLVVQAGFPNGVEVEFGTPVGRYTLDKQISEAMVPMLNAVGIRAKLQTPEWSTLWDNVQKGKVPFYYMGRGGVVDPGRPLSQYFETGVSPRIAYSNPQLDALFARERAAFEPAERKKALSELMSLITEEAPAHFMWSHKVLWGMAKNVEYTPPFHERYYANEMRVR